MIMSASDVDPCAQHKQLTMCAAQFGIFMNEASFGVLFEFPVGDLFPFPVPLGTMTLNCQFHFNHGGLTCGVNYDKPQWVAAVVSDGKMVIGNIKEHFDDGRGFVGRPFA